MLSEYSLSGLATSNGYSVFPFCSVLYFYVIVTLLSRIILEMHGTCLISSLCLAVSSTSFILR
jgi:hypothetical protein